MADAEAVNRRMIDLIGLGDDLFAGICIAPERPGGQTKYRKPSPRYILEMLTRFDLVAERSWMIGDSPSDWEAGIRAGINAAAIVAKTASREIPMRCKVLGVPAYESLTDWVKTVIE
jgi:D-glycero-D-manno-heptose 1,7-bisphosphate phosphatase